MAVLKSYNIVYAEDFTDLAHSPPASEKAIEIELLKYNILQGVTWLCYARL